MLIGEALGKAMETAKAVKEQAVKRHGGESEDSWISTAVTGYRGGEPVVVLFARDLSRHVVVNLGSAAANGYRCDVVSLVFETWWTSLQTSPVTGRPWAQDELQEVAENHQGREKGWVTDCLMVCVYNRAGDSETGSMAYRAAGRRVEWLEEKTGRSGEWGGSVHEAMLKIMSATDLVQALATYGIGVPPGMSPEQADAVLDCMVTGQLAGNPEIPDHVAALYARAGSHREQIIKQRLPDCTVKRFR